MIKAFSFPGICITLTLFFKRHSSIYKRHYILLEIFIAMALIAMTSSLFIGGPAKLLQKEVLSLERMELERAADILFLEWKRGLYKNEISWKELTGGYVANLPVFAIPELSKRKWQSQIQVIIEKEKMDTDDLGAYLLKATLTFKSDKKEYNFVYDLMAQQVAKAS